MPAMLTGRLLQALLVLLAVELIAFLMFRHVGDPVVFLLGQDATPAQAAALRASLGLDRPVLEQYLAFLGRVLQGDLGLSLAQGMRVSRLLLERLPATLELALLACALALLAGLPLGMHVALHPRALSARLAGAATLLGVSVPTFLIGISLIHLFSVRLGWLPSFGRGEVVDLGEGWTTGLLTADGWRHLVLPVLTLAIFQLALIVRLVAAGLREAMASEFVRFARARGLPEARVRRHALRHALLPVLTVVGLQFGGLIAFSIITETVFQWPGLGLLFVQAVGAADVPVLAAYLGLTALVFVLVNLVVDLLQLWIDPRLRTAGRGAEVRA